MQSVPTSVKTITGKTKAWLSGYRGPDDLNQGPNEVISALSYSSADMSSAGWALVGDAEVTVEIPSLDKLVENKVAALNAELKNDLAASHIRQSAIKEKIQKLLAINYEVAA